MRKPINDLKRKKKPLIKIAYKRWYSMFERIGKGVYADCYVCDEWYTFSNYYEWFVANYVEEWEVDKDIKVPGNKCYSPSTCTFVPFTVNSLFRVSKSMFGVKGVFKVPNKERYGAQMRVNGKTRTGGRFDTILEATAAYVVLRKARIVELIAIYPTLETILTQYL